MQFGQLPAPVQSSGFPANYPYAVSSPLPSALLRPLQQPLYDSDVLLAPGVTQNQIQFFQRALGQNDAGNVVKTQAETNLGQSGTLANPLEFSVFAFNFVIQPAVTLADFVAIMTASTFQFTYTGNRSYLWIPLNRIPTGIGPEGFAATTVGATTLSQVKNGVGHISNTYRFTIGKSALRIRPTENFQVILAWPRAVPVIVGVAQPGGGLNGVRLQVFILGLSWTPL